MNLSNRAGRGLASLSRAEGGRFFGGGAASAGFSVTVSGATDNATFGPAAQIGTVLSADASGWTGAVPASVAWQWFDSAGPIPGADADSYAPVAADDLSAIYPVATPSDTYGARAGATLTVRHAPPSANGLVPDQAYEALSEITSLDIASDFLGQGLSFSLAPQSAPLPQGLDLSPQGQLSGAPTAGYTAAMLVVRGSNSGGHADSEFEISVSGSVSVPAGFAISDWLLSDKDAGGTLSITLLNLPADGGAPLTDIEYRIGGGSWAGLGVTAPGVYDIAGLSNGQAYTVELRALNAAGAGPASDTKAAVPTAGLPGAFQPADWSLSNPGTGGALDVQLGAIPAGNGAAVTDIQYRLDAGSWVSSGGIGGFTISGLSDGTTYAVELRALSSEGPGGASDVKQGTPGAGAQMLSAYVLPVQDTLSLQTQDYGLDDVAGSWTNVGDAWDATVPGQISKTTAEAYIDMTQSFAFQDGVAYASVVEIAQMDNNSQGITIRARPSNSNESFPRGRAVHAMVKSFASGDNLVEFEGGTNWAGTITAMGLFDISAVSALPWHIVLAAGQSNMVGYGTDGMDLEKDRWHPRIWNLPGCNASNWSAAADQLDLANEPLQHRNVINNEVGPAFSAARRIVAADAGARVLILPCARAGTALVGTDAAWNPDTTNSNPDLHLFDALVASYQSALIQIGGAGNVVSTSLLWSQGEADGADPAYPAAFAALHGRLTGDLGLSELPTVILGATVPDPDNVAALNVMQAGLDQDSGSTEALADVVYFDGPLGAGWVNSGDEVHFTTEAQRLRGDYAGQLLAARLGSGTWPARTIA